MKTSNYRREALRGPKYLPMKPGRFACIALAEAVTVAFVVICMAA